MRVVGLDLSLTSSGVALILDGQIITIGRIESKPVADATLADRRDRLRNVYRQVESFAVYADLAVVESPSFGQGRQGGSHDRAGLWWLVVDVLLAARIPVSEVSPAARAKYATGKGNAGKAAVVSAVTRRYDREFGTDDEADALVLAAMGARHLGCPIEASLPATHLDAMRNVRWPATEGAPA